MSTEITNEQGSKEKESKTRGGATPEDRSKAADSGDAAGSTRARGGVAGDDRSKSLGESDDTLKG
ncbi:MAG: hypothetical protein QOE96_206 [Blastocatellia bacterium]|jgi:hypothetical protein|nr:hypothetical protein [Blastocatellia bacterium]